MNKYPSEWQRKTIWSALSALAVVFLIITVCSAIWIFANVVGFLQPILIPFAIAVILAYLLDPLVTRMSPAGGWTRTRSILLIFVVAALAIVALIVWLAPVVSMQSATVARQVPEYTSRARDKLVDWVWRYERTFGGAEGVKGKSSSASSNFVNWLLGPSTPPKTTPTPTAPPTATPAPDPNATPPIETIAPPPAKLSAGDRQRVQQSVQKLLPNLERQLPYVTDKIWNLIKKSIGGFLGVTGFLLSLIMVPIYLFFLLKQRPAIEQRWKQYLPLPNSALKDEVATLLAQINHYVIAYFRGQLLVCLVDGILIGTSLMIFGLNFAPLIGLLVVVLTMIPYIGIVVCWIPAVIIAAAQWGDWTHPLIVTAIFIVIQNLEGLFYAPRIVGNSVGLHPMTVIVSIFVWGLLIGGLLGPILAVPLTATIKVLLARYVWGPSLRHRALAQVEAVPVVREEEKTAKR